MCVSIPIQGWHLSTETWSIQVGSLHEQIKVEPSIAMVKDLLDDDLDGHVIYFCGETANIARPDANIHRPVVGMPIISVKIGDHCYHGLCDMGASASAIPYD